MVNGRNDDYGFWEALKKRGISFAKRYRNGTESNDVKLRIIDQRDKMEMGWIDVREKRVVSR